MNKEILTNLTKKERRELRREERREAQTSQEHTAIYQRIFIWSGVLALLGLGVFGFVKIAPSLGNGQTAALALSVSGEDRIKGNERAEITIVEYSDFQCPACAYYQPVVKTISGEFKDSVRVVYRHFPLPQHKWAKLAAYAAEAAGNQGKFWEMVDLIFERQDKWAESDDAAPVLYALAQELGLDMEKFKSDIASDAIKAKVEKDLASGLTAKIDSTPTFFVNGQKIKNPRSLDDFRQLINDTLSVKK
ncbi:MAG: DsbA family protein [Candidatus Niyogibacteria bacterium]|nr:DsbA family protein [Candidatus Niyogibacteria bacterium]